MAVVKAQAYIRIVSRWRICLFLGATSIAASALAQGVTASIRGRVTDATGAPITGAVVTVIQTTTQATRAESTKADGAFAFALAPGDYELSASRDALRSATQRVRLAIGTSSVLEILLTPAFEEALTVSSPALVDRSRSGAIVDQRAIESLPANGRNFIDFVLTTPGVVRDPRRPGDLSFAGQRGTMNSIVVDGSDNNNTFLAQALGRSGDGRSPYQFSLESVQEFEVNSSSYSAEYGRAGGAVINVVTRSGGNQLRTSAFDYVRDRRLNANDYISRIQGQPKGPYHVDQFGFSVGGPIVRDKHFFLAVFDAQRSAQPNPVAVNIPVTTPNDSATQRGIVMLQSLAAPYSRRLDQNVAFVRSDHEIANGRVTVRYNGQSSDGEKMESFDPVINLRNALTHTGASIRKTDTLQISDLRSIGSSAFNEVRLHYARDREPGRANSTAPEATIRQSGQTVLLIGRNFVSPRNTNIWRDQIADTGTAIWREHTFKAGIDVDRDRIFNFFSGGFSGSYTFNSIASFAGGRPSASGERYVQAFGVEPEGDITRFAATESAMFAQDEWRATTRLTFNLGLRLDAERLHSHGKRNPDAQLELAGIDTSRLPRSTQLAPRLSAVFMPDYRTSLRAGYGIFVGRTPEQMFRNALSLNGLTVQTITFTGGDVPTYPATFSSIPKNVAAPQPDIFIFGRGYQTPRVHQASVTLDRMLTTNTTISLNLQYVRGEHLQRLVDANVGQSSLASLPVNGGGSATFIRYASAQPFSNFNRVMEFQSSARSNYRGVTLALDRRFTSDWSARLFYVYGRAKDDKPESVGVPNFGPGNTLFAQDGTNLGGEYASADADVRHRAALVMMWTGVSGWSISGVVSVQSGQPYSATVAAETGSSSDLNNDGNNRNDRAPGVARNGFRLPTQLSIDPRVTREIAARGFRLQLFAEAFNLLNNHNVSAVETTYYTVAQRNSLLIPQTAFGSPVASAGPRIVQLGVKILFE
jgi:hypothetical protein